MADNKDTTEKEQKEDKEAEANNHNYSGHKWGLALAAIVIVVILFMLGAFADHVVNFNRNHGTAVTTGFVGRGMGFERRGFVGQAISTNQVEVSGVVTAVNGQSFTIAGNGTTNTVQTNSSTEFTGATKVNVNDSVVAVGTTNNSTFTASQVVVNNNQ